MRRRIAPKSINTQSSNISGNQILTNSKLIEISNTLVKGEWIADEKGYPKTEFVIRNTKDDDQQIWLLCEVRGTGRAIVEASVDFKTFTYSCDEPEKCASNLFKDGQSLFLYFKSPVKGYLSVFMQEAGEVFRLLPYRDMTSDYESCVPVEADRKSVV